MDNLASAAAVSCVVWIQLAILGTGSAISSRRRSRIARHIPTNAHVRVNTGSAEGNNVDSTSLSCTSKISVRRTAGSVDLNPQLESIADLSLDIDNNQPNCGGHTIPNQTHTFNHFQHVLEYLKCASPIKYA